jgi:acetolactate synthase I/II/III large subunit
MKLTNPDVAAWGRSFGAEGITFRDESEVADGAGVRGEDLVVHCHTSAIQMSAWRRYEPA